MRAGPSTSRRESSNLTLYSLVMIEERAEGEQPPRGPLTGVSATQEDASIDDDSVDLPTSHPTIPPGPDGPGELEEREC